MGIESIGVFKGKSPEVQKQEKVRIEWKNKTTGFTGHGEYMDKETAKAWLDKANKERPDLEHWLKPEDEEKVRIEWKNKITGGTGHGEYTDKETAEAWLKTLNKENPDLEHWLKPEDEEK